MRIVFRMVMVAALAALGVWLWTVLCPSPEKVIRRRFADLARTVSFSAGAGDLARLSAARSLAGYFSTNVEINLDLPRFGQFSSMDREEITQFALAAGSRGGGLQVKFPDIDIKVAPGGQSAVVDLTVTAVVAGDPDPVVQEMKFTLRKTDGEWLITRVETVRTFTILDFELQCLPFIVDG